MLAFVFDSFAFGSDFQDTLQNWEVQRKLATQNGILDRNDNVRSDGQFDGTYNLLHYLLCWRVTIAWRQCLHFLSFVSNHSWNSHYVLLRSRPFQKIPLLFQNINHCIQPLLHSHCQSASHCHFSGSCPFCSMVSMHSTPYSGCLHSHIQTLQSASGKL